MSPIGRIFIVLNLILAVFFLGFASSNLAANQDYKTMLEEEQTAHEATREDLTTRLDAATADRNQLERDLGNVRGQRDDHKANLDRAQSDLADQRQRNDANEQLLATIAGTLQSYDSTNKELADKLETANDAQVAATEARHQAENDRQDAIEAQNALQRQLDGASGQIADLEVELTQTRKDLGDKTVALATVIEVTGVNPGDIINVPQIDGAVLLVSDAIQPGLISINRGADDGVQRGFTFHIFSRGQYKGRARVETVQNDMCTAVILKTFENRTIEEGDAATTRI